MAKKKQQINHTFSIFFGKKSQNDDKHCAFTGKKQPNFA
jgi:hypothetical protein